AQIAERDLPLGVSGMPEKLDLRLRDRRHQAGNGDEQHVTLHREIVIAGGVEGNRRGERRERYGQRNTNSSWTRVACSAVSAPGMKRHCCAAAFAASASSGMPETMVTCSVSPVAGLEVIS